MKFKGYSLVVLCASVLLVNCSKDGDNGADGKNGANGTNGANGANGVDGKSSLTRTTKEAAGTHCQYGGVKIESGLDINSDGVLNNNEVITTQTQYVCDGGGANGSGTIYSSWIDVNLTQKTNGNTGELQFDYKQELPATALTADVVDKAAILMYYKNAEGYIVPVERDDFYTLKDVDRSGFFLEFTAGYIYKQNYLAFLVDTDSYSVDEINNNGAAVRYVIVPGSVQGRSATDLKKLPYSEIAKMYNIKD